MKFFFASDIHGDLTACQNMLAAFEKEGGERLVLLGDLLYHGPRNSLPENYDPKGVIALLSRYRRKILAVRGNCDTEVDQMVLPFPVLADYGVLALPVGLVYLTHGHRYNAETPPPLSEGDILIHGHTHVAGVTRTTEGNLCLNPGSVSMPKGELPASYMVYSDGRFTICRLSDGKVLA